MSNPYTRFETEELILRDELAIDRTLLANERTVLAYLRSGLALCLAGATFMHFSQGIWFTVLGAACIPFGIAVMVFGTKRYRRMNDQIGVVRRDLARQAASGGSAAESRPAGGRGGSGAA